MSMTEQAPPPPAPKKRKYAARRKKLPRAIKPSPELAGLTVTDCAKACYGGNGCVISGTGICGHPRKGGLQGRTMTDPAALERFNRAHKMLGKKAMDARFA